MMTIAGWVALGVLLFAAAMILEAAAVLLLYVAIKCCDETAPYRATYYTNRYATRMEHEVSAGAETYLKEGTQ